MRGVVGNKNGGGYFVLPMNWVQKWRAEGGDVIRDLVPAEEPHFVEDYAVPLSLVWERWEAEKAETANQKNESAKPSSEFQLLEQKPRRGRRRRKSNFKGKAS